MYTKQYYAPEINITQDKVTGRYIGKMITSNGEFSIEGDDYYIVANALERQLYAESLEQYRDLEEEEPEKSKSKGGGGGGGGKQPLAKNLERKRGVIGLLGSLLTSISVDSLSAFLRGAGIAKKVFAVRFAGKLIKARSKKALKKKIIIERNRLFFHINEHMQKHKENVERARQIDLLKSRLKNKQQLAKDLGKITWAKKVRPEGKRDVKKDLDSLRSRVRQNKQKAAELWI